MLFYLTSEDNQDKFDFLKEDYVLSKEIKHDFNQETFLKYIKKEIRNIQIEYLIIDMNIFNPEEVSIQECLDAFLLLNPNTKIIILPFLIEDTGELFGAIEAHEGLFILDNLDNPEAEMIPILTNQKQVMESETENRKEDKRIELTEKEPEPVSTAPDQVFMKAVKPVKVSEGQPLKKNKGNETIKNNVHTEEVKTVNKQPNIMKLEEYMKNKSQETAGWQCENVMIGVLGAERKSGTTTIAFQIAGYLQTKGARVAYVEANNHKHLKSVAEFYGFVYVEEHYIKNAITYYTDSKYDANSGMNFIIFDLGSFEENTERNIKLKDTMDMRFLITGSRSYDMTALDMVIDKLKDKKLNMVFNLVDKKDYLIHEQRYVSEAGMITYFQYCPDITAPGKWEDDIGKVFEEYRI